jgi:hypothetical protein
VITSTASQEQLQLALTAAVSPAPDARAAWQTLIDTVGFYHLSPEAQRLTPAIYSNLLNDHSIPERNRLRGAYKHAWSKNHRILHELRPVLAEFTRHNIRYRVIKGIAVQLSVGVIGNRVVGDVDLLVAREDIDHATEILKGAGFICNSLSTCGQHSSRAPHGALDFHKGPVHVDVHVNGGKQPARLLDSMLEDPGESVDFFGVDISIPPPTLLALHSAFHGIKAASRTDFIQSLVDIVTLVTKRDVRNLVSKARATRLTTALATMNRRLGQMGWPISIKPIPLVPQLLERLVAPAGHAPGDIRRAVFLWQVRFPGWAGVFAAGRHIPGARLRYALWLALGQFEFLEAVLTPARRGFLRPLQPVGKGGLSSQPLFGTASTGEFVVSPVVTVTRDFRAAVTLPANLPEVVIDLELRKPATEKAAVYVNGEQLLHWFPGQERLSCSIKHPFGHLELSVRPTSDVCRDCFGSFHNMTWTVRFPTG